MVFGFLEDGENPIIMLTIPATERVSAGGRCAKMKSKIRVIPHGLGLISSEENQKILEWNTEAFGDLAICKAFEYQAGSDYCVLVYDNENLVGFGAVFRREIKFDTKTLTMGGVGGIIIAPCHRRMGYGTVIMKEACRIIFNDLKCDLGGLLCLMENVEFYKGLGWRTSDAKVFVDRAGEKVPWPEYFMYHPKTDSDIQVKEIDLCGLPW